jgi:DNA (cytosine-5)-methyltransferase 1
MTFIDFFGGAGFIRKGMEKAGHKCVGYCEIDKFAVKSYYAIYGQSEDEWHERDIRTADTNGMPDAECYCAGFPCQAFSIAGKRGGFEDMRGTLVFEVFRLAQIKRPRLLFLENVEGLLNHDNGRTFGTILAAMDEIGFDAQWQLLNSRHFGIPQNRERVFIVGHLRGTSRPEVFPIYGTDSKTLKQVNCGGSQTERVYDTNGIAPCLDTMQGGNKQPKIIQRLINKNRGKITFRNDFNCLDANYFRGLDAHQARTGVLEARAVLTPDRAEKHQNGRRMKEPGEPMFTLTAQDKHGVYYENRIRRLTERECFRLQGATDEDFEKAAKVNSPSQLYKQAGNGATINVIYEIARRLT